MGRATLNFINVARFVCGGDRQGVDPKGIVFVSRRSVWCERDEPLGEEEKKKRSDRKFLTTPNTRIKFKKLYILCFGGVCLLDRHVLVLNQNYEPLSVCSAKRAIILVFLGKAEIIEHHEYPVRSISQSFPLPSVVRLILYIQIPRKGIILSRRNVIKRDNHRCQYCGTSQGAMTVDHVIPKTLGGKDNWDNLVCACIKCNNKKGNRTLEQTNMKLIRQPRVPNRITFIQHFIGIADVRWRPYLFLS